VATLPWSVEQVGCWLSWSVEQVGGAGRPSKPPAEALPGGFDRRSANGVASSTAQKGGLGRLLASLSAGVVGCWPSWSVEQVGGADRQSKPPAEALSGGFDRRSANGVAGSTAQSGLTGRL